ncbi:alpha/beta hydrolase [Bacillus sp. z60-18]|uniref:alpha/beta hydrolase n=1 Tax=unclassified Bacillus (in: firmicutes) TaxID=185979 RepID=UPI00390C6211
MVQEKHDQTGKAAPVTIPGTEQRLMQSIDGKRTYRILIAKPVGEAPPEGFPVIYLLDANSVFGTMVEAVRVQARRPDKTGVVPAVIVGIGYETDAPFDPGRYYDFTLPVSVRDLPQRPDGKGWPEPGGAEAFLTFIEERVKPMIEHDFSVDRKRQAIFGHSLGGLFVLQVLYKKPDLFQTYIAGSPSIHWNPSFFDEDCDFVSRLEKTGVNVNVLLGAGELEKTHKSGMNDNAERLASRLSAFESHGVHAEFHEFAGEGHISVLPVLINRALRFALSPEGRG